MKKISLLILITVLMSILTSCKAPTWLPWVKDDTKEALEVSYDKVEITIAKKDSSNNLSDIDSNQIVTPTDSESFKINGLCQNKAVMVCVKFYVSNKSSETHVFNPYFTISNSSGYTLSNYSDLAQISKINQGTNDEGIKVSGLSKTVEAGVVDSPISYVFVYECTKSPELSMVYQDWYFYGGDKDNKMIHHVIGTLKFPDNYKTFDAPKIVYKDNSIEITSDEATYVDYMIDDGNVTDVELVNGVYSVPVVKTGKYVIKLRSSDLLTQDYEIEVDATVLPITTISIDSSHVMHLSTIENCNEYNVEILDSSDKIVDKFIIDRNNFDLNDKLATYPAGEYNINVYANSTDNKVFKSMESGQIKVTVLSPATLKLNYKEITWDPVVGASKYDIYVNGKLFDSTSDVVYKSTDFNYGDEIYVIAVGGTNTQFSSKASNEVVINTI